MEDFSSADSPYARCVEWLFSQAGGSEGWLAGRPPAPAPREPTPGPPLPADWPQAPPALDHPAGLQAAQAWFQTERARLEMYTRDQFLRIRQQHQQSLAGYYERETDLARREREVQREVQFLTAQAEALRERAR